MTANNHEQLWTTAKNLYWGIIIIIMHSHVMYIHVYNCITLICTWGTFCVRLVFLCFFYVQKYFHKYFNCFNLVVNFSIYIINGNMWYIWNVLLYEWTVTKMNHTSSEFTSRHSLQIRFWNWFLKWLLFFCHFTTKQKEKLFLRGWEKFSAQVCLGRVFNC